MAQAIVRNFLSHMRICGTERFVEKIKPLILSRRETESTEVSDEMWVLPESGVAYGLKTDPKSGAKAVP